MQLLWLAAALPAVMAILFLALAASAWRYRRWAGGVLNVLVSLLFLSVAAALSLIAVGMAGYRNLTAERTAATVHVVQDGPQRFAASFTFPDGRSERFELAGDELYVDAKILKWHPRAQLLGLRTGYQLDRVAGRYTLLDDEQTSPRTVYSLAEQPAVDLHALVRRYPALAPLVDAEYGSATFAPVSDGATYSIRVSGSGLLVRQAGP